MNVHDENVPRRKEVTRPIDPSMKKAWNTFAEYSNSLVEMPLQELLHLGSRGSENTWEIACDATSRLTQACRDAGVAADRIGFPSGHDLDNKDT